MHLGTPDDLRDVLDNKGGSSAGLTLRSNNNASNTNILTSRNINDSNVISFDILTLPEVKMFMLEAQFALLRYKIKNNYIIWLL